MASIKNIFDIVDWGLCVGCGACYYYCEKEAVTLKNIESCGIRPLFDRKICNDCNECLDFCPGNRIYSRSTLEGINNVTKIEKLIGVVKEKWEGHACDDEIRYNASSGGIISALALYCLEKENMSFVIHTGMDNKQPWVNATVQSKNKEDILFNAGSRYMASSPCDKLKLIEQSDRPCVFIGRPCDVSAVSRLRKIRPELDRNLGLVLSFFCAGTPSTQGTLDLLKKNNIELDNIMELHFRGRGWPGGFLVKCKNMKSDTYIPYDDSWAYLNKYRPFRCQICPDGLGELSDITSGDGWHIFDKENNNIGESIVLARSKNGKQIVEKAIKAGYINLNKIKLDVVIEAQNLTVRRKLIFGRLLAMRLLLNPITHYYGFNLFYNWRQISLWEKIKSIIGTIKRIMLRGLWHRNPLIML